MTLAGALAWALVCLAAVSTAVAGATAVRRVLRHHTDLLRERLIEPRRTDLLILVAGDDPDVADAARRLRGVEPKQWAALEPVLVDYLAKFRGDAVRPVRALLAERAVADRARSALRSRRAVRRGTAAHALGLIRDAEAARDIELRLADRDPDVRIAAARALGRLGDESSAHALLAALTGSAAIPPGICAGALIDLGSVAHPAVRKAIAAADPITRSVAIDVAGLTGALELTGDLRRALGADDIPEIRAGAAAALGRLGSPVALPELLAAAAPDEPSGVRAAALRALGRIGDPEALPALVRALGDDTVVADVAARSLVEIGPAGVAALRARSGAGRPSPAAAALAMATLRGQLAPS